VWQIDGYLPVHWLGGLVLIGAAVLGYGIFTPLWVWWNRNIYRRRHERRSPIVCHAGLTTDRLGRKLSISPAVLLHPARIAIDLDETKKTKRYFVPPAGPEPLAWGTEWVAETSRAT
jgi:hypothetical protein